MAAKKHSTRSENFPRIAPATQAPLSKARVTAAEASEKLYDQIAQIDQILALLAGATALTRCVEGVDQSDDMQHLLRLIDKAATEAQAVRNVIDESTTALA